MFQYYIVFVLLVLEITFLVSLLFPLPSFIVSGILSIMLKLRHMIRFTAVVLLFFTVDQTIEMRKEEERQTDLPKTVEMSKDSYYRTRKFRAERNFYLCAFTFSLLVILLRLEVITRNLREVQNQLVEAKKLGKEQ